MLWTTPAQRVAERRTFVCARGYRVVIGGSSEVPLYTTASLSRMVSVCLRFPPVLSLSVCCLCLFVTRGLSLPVSLPPSSPRSLPTPPPPPYQTYSHSVSNTLLMPTRMTVPENMKYVPTSRERMELTLSL